MTKVFRLDNGISVICDERPGSGKVSMQILINSGSAAEAAEENGLTSLMQEATMGGTATRSRLKIAQDVEDKGGTLESTTTRSRVLYAASALTRHAADTFEVLADVVRNPVFKPAEINKSRKQLSQFLKKQQESQTSQMKAGLFESCFQDQAVGRDAKGTADLLSSFSVAQIRERHKQLLAGAEGIAVSFSGDISAATAQKLAANYFSDLPPGPALRAPAVTFTGGDFRVANADEQMNIAFAFPGPAKSDSDYYTAVMLQDLLSGGMSSPLFQEIRDKRGLVYDVGAMYAPVITSGIFAIIAGTGKEHVGELVTASFDLLGDVVRNGFSEQDMAISRARLIRGRSSATETSAGSAGANSAEVLDFGRLISDAEFAARLDAVTNDDIRRLCGGMLASAPAISAVGPQEDMPAEADIRAMMQKQLEGVVLPSKAEKDIGISPAFEAAAAQEQRTAEPQISVLPNGLTVVTFERPGNLACGAWVGVGADNEPAAINGASHMMEHMMFKGTPSFAPGEIARILEKEFAADLNAYTSLDRTCYYFFDLDPSALDKVTQICGEMIFQANISNDEFDGRERNVVLEEIKRANDNIENTMGYKLMESAYPDQPHGKTVLGPAAILSRLTVEEMRDYRDKYYVPNNAVFCAVGPVSHEAFKAGVESRFGQLIAKNFPDAPVPVYKGGTAVIETPKAGLCTFYLGAEAVPLGHADETAYALLGSLIAGGDSAKLYNELVNEKETCLTLFSGIQAYRSAGLFLIGAITETENVQAVMKDIYGEIRGLAGKVSDADLEKVKTQLECDILKELESNSEACNEFARAVQDNGRLMTSADFLKQVYDVTADDIRRVAKQVLASNPTAIMLAPQGTPAVLLPNHQAVVDMRDGRVPKLSTQTPTLDII